MIHLLPFSTITALVEESLDAVLIIDELSTVRYLNPSMAALSGYAAAELAGQPFSKLLDDSFAGGGEHDAYVANFVTTRRSSAVLGRVRDFAILHRNGELIPVRMKAVDLGEADGMRYLGAFMEDLRPRRELEARQQELLAQLEHQALTDALTGLPNRRAFYDEGAMASSRARRSAAAATVGVADIDHFKSINDRYGHAAGDQALRELAQVIRSAMRADEVVARTGGEEVGMLFPQATVEQARIVAERVRTAVQAHEIRTPQGEVIRATLSIGLAPLAPGADFEAALEEADRALYRAKQGGRNRVEV